MDSIRGTEEWKKQARDRILGQIPHSIETFLQTVGSTPTRILSDTPSGVLATDDNLSSI